MKVRVSAPAALISTLVLILVLSALINNRMSSGLIGSVEESRFQLMRAIVVNGMAETESKALARAELVASLPSIQEKLRAGLREELLDETSLMFEGQQNRFGVAQAQFFVPPTTSFLRLNDPEKFGDDVQSFRPMIVECFKDHLSLKGVSISRSGAGIFGVAPVRDGAGEIGVFEFGLDFAPLLDGLKAQYGFDVALYIEEQPLRATATNLPGDVFTDENRVGKYIRVHTTHLERMRQLVTDRDLSGGGEQKYVREAGGLPYGVLVIPVRNYAGKELGVIAIAGDFAGSRAASSETVAWQALITLFGIVVCVGAILVVLRGMVLRPLREVGEKLQALASGNHEAAIEGADEMCEELQELAAAHETLRTKAASNSEPATQEET